MLFFFTFFTFLLFFSFLFPLSSFLFPPSTFLLFQMQRMSHAFLLGLQVAQVILVGSHLDGHVLHNLQSVGLESYALHWVVGHESHLMYTQMAQHLCPTAIVAFVGLEAQTEVGIHCVVALFMQFIGSELVHEPYAASFLLHIDDDTLAFLLYLLHGLVQLFAAVAAS